MLDVIWLRIKIFFNFRLFILRTHKNWDTLLRQIDARDTIKNNKEIQRISTIFFSFWLNFIRSISHPRILFISLDSVVNHKDLHLSWYKMNFVSAISDDEKKNNFFFLFKQDIFSLSYFFVQHRDTRIEASSKLLYFLNLRHKLYTNV